MIKRIIKLLIFGVLMVGLLSFGGYTVQSFKNEVHLKDPQLVFAPITNNLPSLPSGDNNNEETTENSDKIDLPDFSEDPGINDPGNPLKPGDTTENPEITEPETPNSTENPYVDEDGNIKKQEINIPSANEIKISYVRSIKITIDGKEAELTSSNTITFIKWLTESYKDDSEIGIIVNKENPDDELSDEFEVNYNEILESEDDLDVIVKSINVVETLPEYDDYDRNTYEKPTQSYMLNGKKTNRNDYAWKTSKFFDEETFTYMCPYTGTIIKDLDDNKEDLDFGNLDYDHIVSLHTVERSCPDWWTDTERNNYAYDQSVGVDVINSANRSKSDKTPSEWLPEINTEDYCYHYLIICSKYELSMTQEDLDVCYDVIITALENGETVELLNSHMSEPSK